MKNLIFIFKWCMPEHSAGVWLNHIFCCHERLLAIEGHSVPTSWSLRRDLHFIWSVGAPPIKNRDMNRVQYNPGTYGVDVALSFICVKNWLPLSLEIMGYSLWCNSYNYLPFGWNVWLKTTIIYPSFPLPDQFSLLLRHGSFHRSMASISNCASLPLR